MLSRRKFFGGSLAGALAGLWPFKTPPKTELELSPVVTEYSIGGWELLIQQSLCADWSTIHSYYLSLGFSGALAERNHLHVSHHKRDELATYKPTGNAWNFALYQPGWDNRVRTIMHPSDCKTLPSAPKLWEMRRPGPRWLPFSGGGYIPISIIPRTCEEFKQNIARYAKALLERE